MAEVIWTDNATGWRIDALAYGGSTFGQKSAEKLDNTFKAYSRLLSTHPLLGHREPLLAHITGLTYRSILVHRNYKLIYRVEPVDSGQSSDHRCLGHPYEPGIPRRKDTSYRLSEKHH